MILLSAALLFGADTWSDKDLIQPDQLARDSKTPLVIHVGFSVLYRAGHITGAQAAGPASKAQGIADLKKLVADQPLDREIVLYCGCCSDQCPNTRRAFAALREMGFTHVRAMAVTENFKADWVEKGYPTEK